MNNLILILTVVSATGILGLWWALRQQDKPDRPAPADMPTILFRHGVIEHASDSALELLPIAIGLHNWADLYDILSPQFPEFPHAPLAGDAPDTLVKGITGEIQISWQNNGASIVFRNTPYAVQSASELDELNLLRQVSANSPFPAWKTDETGNVKWNNDAYEQIKSRLSHHSSESLFKSAHGGVDADSTRVKVELEGPDGAEWFNVIHKPVCDGIIHYATSLKELIHAEEAQRDFVQTLAKTFAHLSIGLAIFDRNRQLALFNPALTDLTGLSASFLSPRPTIDSFFDAMRENRRMPEPKNYKTWRQRMADLVSAAETGKFEETWSLETGQTYQIKGRPHPDGAIAFLIEDISAEVVLTRNFRAELELSQSLFDTIEEPLVVFSQTGVLTFSNKAYDRLWGFERNTSFADVTVTDAIRLWKEKTLPNPLWQALKDTVMQFENRKEWHMTVTLNDQKPMQCKVQPIAAGATAVWFSSQNSTLSTEDAPRETIEG